MFNAILLYKGEVEFAYMLLLTAACMGWGAGPERTTAGSIAFMFLAALPYHWVVGTASHLSTIDIGNALIDGVTAVTLLVIALFANRTYTLWLAALQLISLSSHVIRALSTTMLPLTYAILSAGPSYLELVVLTAGLVWHVRRVRRYGPYRSWRRSSLRSPERAAPGLPKDR